MKLYSVLWIHDKDLSKGKGRCHDLVTSFTVICNNPTEALRCLNYHWFHHYKSNDVFEIDDGEVQITRCKIDSRNFHANYLIMDKMPEPLELAHIDQSLMKYCRRYQ